MLEMGGGGEGENIGCMNLIQVHKHILFQQPVGGDYVYMSKQQQQQQQHGCNNLSNCKYSQTEYSLMNM